MLVFLLQIRALAEGYSRQVYLFAVFTAIIWLVWAAKVLLSRRYEPWTRPHEATTSVVIPVVDEPEDLFREVLTRIAAQRPTEIIVVINGLTEEAKPEELATMLRVCAEFPQVTVIHTPTPGKRNAVHLGVLRATGEIVFLVDSDTLWTPNVLIEVLKPFGDPAVGGVTTRQRILDPKRSFITRWADWLENSRAAYSMPAQSVTGQIGCLPGRTIAFRRSILERVMPEFLHEEFLGVFLEVSDDRTLTNLTLKAHYRTVYQSTALVYTDCPTRLRKLAKQQLRWARGSQYNTLRMLPWMLAHAPVLAFFFVADIVLPFLFAGAVMGWAYRSATGDGYNYFQPILRAAPGWTGWAWALGLAVGTSWISMTIRQWRHIKVKGQRTDALLMPLYVMFSSLFLMPIRVLGFIGCAHPAGWGTRANAYAGGASTAGTAVPEQPGPLSKRYPLSHDEALARTRVATLAPVTVAQPAPAPLRRTPNPYAAIPYLIALAILAVEALTYA